MAHTDIHIYIYIGLIHNPKKCPNAMLAPPSGAASSLEPGSSRGRAIHNGKTNCGNYDTGTMSIPGIKWYTILMHPDLLYVRLSIDDPIHCRRPAVGIPTGTNLRSPMSTKRDIQTNRQENSKTQHVYVDIYICIYRSIISRTLGAINFLTSIHL